ncbi:hypothetical protein ASPWEDRAFT_52264 [Aspergillus wentii DTO 134E9]|uniref:DNA replication regulator SLD2 n=1 Tax=Aspergillus wentii DTO 134E9 TaxID=1073089 RepID=A0A1L9RG34_ASPWE|nr:uncharacterized protein ASPWEDRAFT_52264 [Aspergillus wentii DTO 134E9]KAI9925647.1 DNA replication regulator sld2 [Aspergillus wentii]OJJ33885.1 hypothetical protein ASPWEDRAFT_52264 [Aspergillus wentii DTO 134E9]
MATAAVSNSADYATLSANLRVELKEWERGFAAANDGKKAERGDIKKVPEIAAKYKEYSRLKALEAKGSQPTQLEERPKKRKHTSPTGPENSQTTSTPRKASKSLFETPSKVRATRAHPSEIDPYDSPSALRRLFSPSSHMQKPSPLKAAVGPTPQRDGKALGLFDLLSESGGSTATPSATRVASTRGEVAQTPSKKKPMDTIAEEEEEEESPRGARTPASSGKKYMLANLFATPTTLRYAAMVEDEETKAAEYEKQTAVNGATQGGVGSDTPSFLRRSNSGRYGGSNAALDGSGLSPMGVRKRPQFVGKGLSAIVQGLRDMEEERLEDDLDALREMEAEAEGMNVDVADSQPPENNTGRPYKKKGQKRTTRRVRMKPVLSKPKPEPRLGEQDSDDGGDDEEPAAIPDTQLPNIAEEDEGGHDTDEASLHTMSEPDIDSDPDYGDEKPKSFSEKMKEAISVSGKGSQERQEKAPPPATKKEETKKAPGRPRKVNPEAHANYRSLKIRSRGSRGRGGARFGRR